MVVVGPFSRQYRSSFRARWDFLQTLRTTERSLDRSCYSVVSLERTSPGVSGGIVLPFSISVGFTFEFLFSDVFVCIWLSILLLNCGGRGSGNQGEDNSCEFHSFLKFILLLLYYKFKLYIYFFNRSAHLLEARNF